jgi:aspartate racemase
MGFHMRIAGIIGGVGPESTVEYYRLLNSRYRERNNDGSYPSLLINSIDLKRMVDLITANRLPEVIEYLTVEIQRLARAGADFGAISANTPHIVFDEVRASSPIPLISIVEVACQSARSQGMKRVGLFGTRFTMQGRFYAEAFAREGIRLAVPLPLEQEFIHDKYMNELVNGVFLAETRDRLLQIAERLRADEGVEALILGGTELPLILKDGDGPVPFLDTTRLHVEEIVSQLLPPRE